MKLSDFSQQNNAVDKPHTIRLNQAEKLQYADPQQAYDIACEIYRLSDKDSDADNYLRAIYLKGRTCWHLGKYDEALYSASELLENSKKLKSESYQSEAFNLLGNVNLYMDNLDQALEYYREGLRLARNSHNSRAESSAYNNIGEIYNKLNAFDQAREYYTKALQLSEATSQSSGVGIAYLNLGDLAMKEGQYDLAMRRGLDALEVFKKTVDRMGEAHVHCLIADIFSLKEDTDKAETHYLEAEKIENETGDQYMLLKTGLAYTQLLIKQSKFEEAEMRCRQLLEIAQNLGSDNSYASALSLLANIYESQGKFKEALDHYKLYHNWDLKTQKDMLNERLTHIRSQFRIEQTQHEKEIFKLKNVELQSKNRELQKLHDDIEVISRIGRDITSTLDLELIFKRIYENINTLMDASFFGICLYDEDDEIIEYPLFITSGQKVNHKPTALNDMNSLSAWCIRNKTEIFTNDYLSEYTRYKQDPMTNRLGRMSQSIIYVPLFIEDKIIGTLTAQSYARNAYTKHHLDMLKALASYTAIAIRNGQESEQLEEEISRRKKAQAKLESLNRQLTEMTYIDSLTKIPNRRHFAETLIKELSRSVRESAPLALLLIDIDKFKEYNDNYGHTEGDTCLYTIAQILKSSLKRKTDFVARYGGDEFIAVLPNTELQGALQVAEDMRQNVENAQIEHKYSTVSPIVSITLGIYAQTPTSDMTLERVVQFADHALYTAKDMGRNCIAANISPLSFEDNQ